VKSEMMKDVGLTTETFKGFDLALQRYN